MVRPGGTTPIAYAIGDRTLVNNDPKSRILFAVALGLTFMAIMMWINPPPPVTPVSPEKSGPAPVVSSGPTQAAVAPAAAGEDDPALSEFNPTKEYEVVVRVGDAEPGGNGYEASFSSVGAALGAYRLLGYYRLPKKEQTPGDEVILLDHLANGRDSLRIDVASFGPSRQNLTTLGFGALNYELLEVPEFAEVSPEPDPGVRRGDKLVFRAVQGDWEVIKTFTFPQGEDDPDFTIKLDIDWRNLAKEDRLLLYRLAGPTGLIPDDNSSNFSIINFLTAKQTNPADAAVEVERVTLNDVARAEGRSKPDNRSNMAWVGAKNRFFATMMSTDPAGVRNSFGGGRRAFAADPALKPTEKDIVENLKSQPVINVGFGDVPAFEDTALEVEAGFLPENGVFKGSYSFYGGPAVDDLMEKSDARFHGVISYTIRYFDFISRWLVQLLTFLDKIFGNYGLAIIAVTLIVRLLLHPLNRKSFVSMNKMQKLAPEMKALQKKYANDKVKLQQSISKLYKDNKVSMAGGCLPVFIQLPIFFALYGAFSQGFAMRHATFIPGWIVDLSKPDSIYDFGWHIPLLQSSQLSLLPILYLGLQYFQMSLQPKPSDPQQASQQRIMKIMPLMFVFIFYSMPAGLVLYFAVSALFGVAENWWMRKHLFPKLGMGDAPQGEAAPEAAKAGVGAAEVKTNAKKRKKK